MYSVQSPAGAGVIVWRQASEPYVPATMKPGRRYSVVTDPNTVSVGTVLGTNLTAVTKDLTLAYEILAAVNKDFAFSYNIIGTAQKDLALVYTIIGTAEKDLALVYGIASTVTKDLGLTYDILAAGSVVKDFALSYSILASVEKDLTLTNFIFNAVTKDFALAYSVTGSVTKNLSLIYSIDGGSYVIPNEIDELRIYQIPVTGATIPEFSQDPDEILDYGFDASLVLAELPTDSVSAFDIKGNHPINILAEGIDTNDVYGCLLGGGYNRASSLVTCRIIMASGRIIESSIKIKIATK